MRKDIRIDNDEDFKTSSGDFIITDDSDRQVIFDISSSNNGFYKENPNIGLNMRDDINAPKNDIYLSKKIRKQITDDGMRIIKIDIEDIEDIKINAVSK